VTRLFRILLNTATVLSLLLFAAVIALWVASYVRTDWFGYESSVAANHRQWGGNASSAGGAIWAEWWVRYDPAAPINPSSAFVHSTVEASRATVDAQRRYVRSLGGFQFLGVIVSRRDMDPTPGARNPNPGAPPRPQASQTVHNLVLPWWLPTLLFGVPPLWRLERRRRLARRKAHGLCQHCGFDLRATPDRCPECGAIPQASR
jgi:hypothetical protein